MAELSFLSNIKVSAPLPTDWKYRVDTRNELISILSSPNNYPYRGQLAVVVDDGINTGLYLLLTEPNLYAADSGLTLANWKFLQVETYVGTTADTKPDLKEHQAGIMFYETDSIILSIWTGTNWDSLIVGGAEGHFIEYNDFDTLDAARPGTSHKLYVVLHNEVGEDLNTMYRWDATHDNGDGTFGRYEMMGGTSTGGGGEMVNPVTSELPEHVGGIAPGQTVPTGTDLEAFVDLLLRPLVLPTKINNYLSITNIPTSLREVGTTITHTLSPTYNQGLIENKNGSGSIPLTGPEGGTVPTRTFIGVGIDPITGEISTPILAGNNKWSVSLNYTLGTGDYFDSKGHTSCIFDIADAGCPTGDGSRAPGTVVKDSNTIVGIYPYLYGGSAVDLSTGGSALYSALIKKIAIKSNKTLSIQVNAEYIYFSYPKTHGLLTVILDGNGFNVFGNFSYTEADVVSVGGNNYTETYYIYKTLSKTSVDPAQNYQFKY